MRGIPAVLIVLISISITSPSFAQTTQPAEPSRSDWSSLVAEVQQSLVTGDAGSFHALVVNAGPIRGFKPHESPDALKVMDTAASGVVLGGHAYIYPPLVMAADVAADFKSTTMVADHDKRKMIPQTDDEMKRANATAAQWVRQMLGAEKGDAVGLIVLWHATEVVRAGEPVRGETVFLLIRGIEADNAYHITQVMFGTPQPSSN